jgi:hypothetical protein
VTVVGGLLTFLVLVLALSLVLFGGKRDSTEKEARLVLKEIEKLQHKE